METDEWYTVLEYGIMPYYRFELRKDDKYLRVISFSDRNSRKPQPKPRIYKLEHHLPENINPEKNNSFAWFPLTNHSDQKRFKVSQLCRRSKKREKGTFYDWYRVEGRFKSLDIYVIRDYVLLREETHG